MLVADRRGGMGVGVPSSSMQTIQYNLLTMLGILAELRLQLLKTRLVEKELTMAHKGLKSIQYICQR